jgi:hypothetical protein
MDTERREKVARATQDLLAAVRELQRAKNRDAPSLLAKSAPQRFLKAIEAFAGAIGD